MLDDGLQFAFHLLLHGEISHEIAFHFAVVDGIDGFGLCPVKLEHIAVFHVLVNAVEIVHGKGVFGGRVEQVDAESEIQLLVTDKSENGGHNVDLLGHSFAHPRLDKFAAGVVDDDRRAETADVALVFVVVALVGVVVCEHKDSVLEPRLLSGFFKEPADGHICVADALVDGQLLLFVDIAVFLGNLEGMVRRACEHSGHEGWLHLRHLCAIVLQERFVPDAPVAVEVFVTAKTAVGSIVFTTIVLLESCLVGEGHEAHRTTIGTVEECGLVALVGQQSTDAGVVVHGRGREHKRFHEHGDAAKHRRHSVDALPAVAERMAKDQTMGNQRVEMWCVALVAPTFEMLVEGSDVFLSETFDNHDDNVAWLSLDRVSGLVDGRVDAGCFFDAGIIVRNVEHALADGAKKRKRCVEYNGALRWAVDVLVGVVDGDGSDSVPQSSATTAD